MSGLMINPQRHWLRHSFRRTSCRVRSAAEVSELARNPDLLEGADPLWPGSQQGGHTSKGFGILVEDADFGQVIRPVSRHRVVRNALTAQQVQQLHRFASKVVLSFDPDAAGQGAAAKSCDLFVADGFEVNVAQLPVGQDPDVFIRAQGAQPTVNG